jgi:arylsulfatase A-like enzyme
MGDRTGRRRAALLIVGGLVVAALAFAAEAVPGSARGFGTSQALLLGAGLLGLLGGVFLLTPVGARFLASAAPPGAAVVTPGRVVVLGVWLGLLTGLGEMLLLELVRFRIQPFLGPAPPVPWMAAVTDVVMFGLLGGAAGLLAARGRIRASTISAFFVCLLLISLALHFREQVHPAALAVFAAGVASRMGRGVAAHWIGLHRLVRRTAIPLALAVIGVAAARPVTHWRAERQALSELPEGRAGAPNLLLIILDTVRASSLGLYGYERETSPGLTRRARAGVTFERALSPAPWTLPSHASALTGVYPHDLRADWSVPVEAEPWTLAEALAERGYLTGGFVANRVYASRFTGLDRGFAHYDDGVTRPSEFINSVSLGQTLGGLKWLRRLTGYHESLGRKPAHVVSDEFLGWQAGVGGRPFFAFLNFFDAHDPYLPPGEFAQEFVTGPRPCDHASIDSQQMRTREELQGCVDAYDASILALDARLEELFLELERRGALENTLVIVTSDHGEEFGEKGVVQHGRSLNLASVHVPLVLILPGRVPAGHRVEQPVSLRDLPATVATLLGLDDMSPGGESLVRYWSSDGVIEATGDEAAGDVATGDSRDLVLAETSGLPFMQAHNPVSRGHMQAALEGDLYFILNGDGSTELYDIVRDPWCQTDLSSLPEHRETVARLQGRLRPVAERYAEVHGQP